MSELYATHSSVVLRSLLRLTRGDRPAAEDVLQETMLRAWRHITHLPVEESRQRSWLLMVARNIFIDNVRRQKIRPTEMPLADLAWIPQAPDIADTALVGDTVRHAFRELSQLHQEALATVYVCGRSVEDAATQLGVPIGTIKSRLHYGMRALRRELAICA